MTVKYKYRATTESGKKVRGTQSASSVKSAMAGLVERGLDVSQLKEKKSILSFEITNEKLPQAELMHFSRQLSAFVRAGIPLIEALDVIDEEADDKTLRKMLVGVRESLVTGDTFSDALRPYETLFPKFYIDMVRAAELTGSLDTVLAELARYIKRDMEARKKVKSALVYPAVILVMAIGTVIVLSTFVLPRFKTFFDSFHATLPLPTRMLVAFTSFIAKDWIAIVGVIVLLITLPLIAIRTSAGRRAKDRLVLRFPVVGQAIRFAIIERFCRLLATMLTAGVPLPEAIGVLGEGTKNVVFQRGMADVRAAMLRGEGLAQPMSATKLFPGAVIQMVRVGENTGTLDAQLESGSEYYGEELEYKLQRLTALFEPAVIIVMGVAVGFVAIALISAMYGIYKQVKI